MLILFSVIFSLVSSQIHAGSSGYTIYTRITKIDLPPTLVFRENYPNQTFFAFEGLADIINPCEKNLYIGSSTTCLVFYQADLAFENDSYSGLIWGPSLCGQAFTNHTIEPGINEGYIFFELSVNETLQNLPNGNFTIRLHLEDYHGLHDYVHFNSTITVNDSNITMSYEGRDAIFTCPTFSTLPTVIPNFIVVLMSGILVMVILRKKARVL